MLIIADRNKYIYFFIYFMLNYFMAFVCLFLLITNININL